MAADHCYLVVCQYLHYWEVYFDWHCSEAYPRYCGLEASVAWLEMMLGCDQC